MLLVTCSAANATPPEAADQFSMNHRETLIPNGPAIPTYVARTTLLLLGCLGISVLARRVWKPNARRDGRALPMELTHQLRIGPRATLHLVRVGDKSILVGTTESNICCLLSEPVLDPKTSDEALHNSNSIKHPDEPFVLIPARTGARQEMEPKPRIANMIGDIKWCS